MANKFADSDFNGGGADAAGHHKDDNDFNGGTGPVNGQPAVAKKEKPVALHDTARNPATDRQR